MHQASILFTAAVMVMAGAWYVMQDMTREAGVAPPAEQHAALSTMSAPLAE